MVLQLWRFYCNKNNVSNYGFVDGNIHEIIRADLSLNNVTRFRGILLVNPKSDLFNKAAGLLRNRMFRNFVPEALPGKLYKSEQKFHTGHSE